MLVFEAMHRPTCSGGFFFLGKVNAAVLSWLLVYGFRTYWFLWSIQQGPFEYYGFQILT